MSIRRDIMAKVRRLCRIAHDQGGAATVEYMLLLALIGLPSLVIFRLLLAVLSEYYKMLVLLETLPMS